MNDESDERGEDKVLENSEGATTVPELDFISCASLSLDTTVTATLLKYLALAGIYIYNAIYNVMCSAVQCVCVCVCVCIYISCPYCAYFLLSLCTIT